MKLLLLDKDGTLTIPHSGKAFPEEAWDQSPILGVKEAIGRYRAKGFMPIIISNQGGVERGYKSLEECKAEMRYAMLLFPEIKEAFFCPNFAGSDCWRIWGKGSDYEILYNADSWTVQQLDIINQFRKPYPGMLKLACDVHGADEAIFVGDRKEDEQAASAAGIDFLWADDWVKS
ncbi:putative hydrolase, HAD-superfamily, subfamily IIIA [Calothrix sp. NIES-4101]|nr:putative hydrolase, HAD-superfamily, subfamily IIIA [Calothrix sp. NIES-4101]